MVRIKPVLTCQPDTLLQNAWERRLEQDRKSPLVRYYQAWLEAEDQQAAMLEDHDQREVIADLILSRTDSLVQMEEGDDDDDEGDEAPELVPMATDAQASDRSVMISYVCCWLKL